MNKLEIHVKNMPELNKPVVIGIGGHARAGKDTFVKIAKKILKGNGYSSIRLAFADALKEEIDPFLKEYYGISAWTEDPDEKKIIRPLLVAHGCQKRVQNPTYWIDKVNEAIETIHFTEDVVFISDCRFPNEADWVHEKWSGWFVHVRKYVIMPELNRDLGDGYKLGETYKLFDGAPNQEEAENDPICERKADYKLEMENAIEREYRLTGNKITVDSLIDNIYLNNEITICLSKCPFLTFK